MAGLQVLSVTHVGGEAEISHISDLELLQISGEWVLVSTTRYDGVIATFRIGDAAIQLGSLISHDRTDAVATPAMLEAVTINGQSGVLTGGGYGAEIRFIPIAASGASGDPVDIGFISGIPADLTEMVTVTLPSGRTAVYGGIEANDGIGRLVFSDSGSSLTTGWTRDYADTFADGVGAIASATFGSTTFIFTAGQNDPGITTWAMDWRGFLSNASALPVSEGLWISAPAAMETVTFSGGTYLVLASAGSGSLSVMSVAPTGALTVVDHVIDDLDTRFSGATAIATTQANGSQWIAVGGSDDGISIFVLLAGGRLVHVATIADTTSSGLADISALEMRAATNQLDIFAASASEFGITRIGFDLTDHDVITGTTGNDTLSGGAGVDIIVDGAGSDVMTGGTGADVFVLAADGKSDRITDFQLGTDRIDLGDWPQLRSLAQLALTFTTSGFTLAYGDERLTVTTVGDFDRDLLTAADIIGASHLPRNAISGYPEPFDPDAELPPQISTRPVTPPVTPVYDTDDPTELPHTDPSTSTPDIPVPNVPGATPEADLLRGTRGADRLSGLGGNDRIYGYGGDDTLLGGAGNDRIVGGSGNDRLIGGSGNDVMLGKSGNDKLMGRSGNDLVKGGGGDDLLKGQSGRDILRGGAGSDALFGGSGNDRLFGGGANDRLVGGGGRDKLTGQGGDDRLIGNGGRDILKGGRGHDYLDGGKGNDLMTGGSGADTFVYNGGIDVITDWKNNDTLQLDDKLWRGDVSPAELLARNAEVIGGDLFIRFGDGNRLELSDLTTIEGLIHHIEFI